MEKRTTIFSIFVLLCLLPNSIYARTIEYETPKDTTLDMTLYFDLNARQVDKLKIRVDSEYRLAEIQVK